MPPRLVRRLHIASLAALLSASSLSAQSLGVTGPGVGTPSLCAPTTRQPKLSARLASTYSLVVPSSIGVLPRNPEATAPVGHLGFVAQSQYRTSPRFASVLALGPSLFLNSIPFNGQAVGVPLVRAGVSWCAGAEAAVVQHLTFSTVLQSHGLSREPRNGVITQEWTRTPTVVPRVRVGF